MGADDRPDRISAEVSVTQPLKDGLVITPGLVGSLTDSGPSMTVCIGWKWGFL